jgi:hypothetical protein
MDREPLEHSSLSRASATRLSRVCCRLSAWATGVALVVLAGCATTAPFARNDFGSPLPANASVEEVVRRVNANVERLQAWRSNDLSISGENLPVHLGGTIAVERPRNFRLTAGILGIDEEADFGSNNDWFWFWVKRGNAKGQPSYVYQARHEDVPNSQVLSQIPFQPDWLMEALGVVPIDAQNATLRPEQHGQIVNLISERLSPSGQTVKKVIRVDRQRGVILSHSLYDMNGTLIAKARLENYSPDKATGIVLPHLIALEWPQADLKINLAIGQIDVNPTTIPPRNWQVPQKPYYPAFDIGAMTRKQMPMNGGAGGQSGRIEPASAAAPVSGGPSEQFGAPSPLAKPARPSAGAAGNTASWPEADNGTEWNRPIEASPSSGKNAPADANPFATESPGASVKAPPSDPARSASADNPFADPPPRTSPQSPARTAPANPSPSNAASNGGDPFESLPH